MGKSTPAQPDPPDYAAASREGVYADIETLPIRRQLERGARLGEKVNYDIPLHKDAEGEWVMPSSQAADFTGLGDLDLTKAELTGLAELAPLLSEAQLSNLVEYGPKFIEAQRAQLRQTAPEEFDLREEFATRLRAGEGTAEELAAGAPTVPEYEEFGEAVPTVPGYEEVGATPDLTDAGLTAEMRADVEESIADRLALGEGLSGEQVRAVEQDILKAAAKRGQTMGGGTALREILGKFRAGEELGRQRRGEATGWLASGQASADVQNRLAQQNFANTMQKIQQVNQARGATFAGQQQNFGNTMQRVQQINQARAAEFAGQQQNLGLQFGGRQQDISNIQSLLGLQPIAAQGGYLAGMQQGAAPFTMAPMQRGTGLDPNAAANASQFAGNVFGTQAQMWQTEASKPSMFSEITSGLGALGGGAGSTMTGWSKLQ